MSRRVGGPPLFPSPRRGEIWTALTGDPPVRHWVLVVSLDSRNVNDRVDSVLTVPFSSTGMEGPTTLLLQPGETGLPGPSYLKGHFIGTLRKTHLQQRLPRPFSDRRMREVCLAIRRAFEPDAPVDPIRISR
jgi:mRNA-degrading endonuclease toxin of MazEF toxin-antitoxin module